MTASENRPKSGMKPAIKQDSIDAYQKKRQGKAASKVVRIRGG